ncbi:hypothetical protein ZEAMMB73_Zm00001d015687 [Zea mays]|uniref:Myb/SANT-like domain-containing protein n=2 Tax=Zea mays TaxID=4577 RepID=A0A1D6H379_MAIZE|nr:hypothetical protein ZEAMMB73_Zm00001d015687 [Zea mays]
MGLTKYGWQQVYHSFREQTGLDYDNKKLQYKLNLLRRSFQQWQYLQNHTGLGLEPRTSDIVADDSYWGTQEGGNLISVGGVREPLRSYGSHGTPDDGVGCSSKRIREATVDSPPKKKMSLEDHIANISDCISIRNQLDLKKTLNRGNEEVVEVVRLLKED